MPILRLIRFGGINSVLSFKFDPNIEAHKHPCSKKKINGFKRFSHSHVFIHFYRKIYIYICFTFYKSIEENREKKFNATIELWLNLLCRFVLAIRCVCFFHFSHAIGHSALKFSRLNTHSSSICCIYTFSICDSCVCVTAFIYMPVHM